MIIGSEEYMYARYGKEAVENWLENIEVKNLMDCMEAFSNASFVSYEFQHRDKDLNILEMILQETPQYLYASVTYGVAPNSVCTYAIGELTGRKYGNVEIAIFLIQQKIKELKEWLIKNHKFTEREKRLLHYNL